MTRDSRSVPIGAEVTCPQLYMRHELAVGHVDGVAFTICAAVRGLPIIVQFEGQCDVVFSAEALVSAAILARDAGPLPTTPLETP